jgi:hypothetical protein
MPLKSHCYHQANKCGRQEGHAKSFRFLLYSWSFLTSERSLFEDQIETFLLFIQWVVFVRYSRFLRPKRPSLYLSGFILTSFLKGCFVFFPHNTLILRTPREAFDYLRQDQRVFCIVNKSLYKDLDKVRGISYIIEEEGGKLIISNRGRLMKE